MSEFNRNSYHAKYSTFLDLHHLRLNKDYMSVVAYEES